MILKKGWFGPSIMLGQGRAEPHKILNGACLIHACDGENLSRILTTKYICNTDPNHYCWVVLVARPIRSVGKRAKISFTKPIL